MNEVIVLFNDYMINMLNVILNYFICRIILGVIEKILDFFLFFVILEENKNNKEMSGEKKINGK